MCSMEGIAIQEFHIKIKTNIISLKKKKNFTEPSNSEPCSHLTAVSNDRMLQFTTPYYLGHDLRHSYIWIVWILEAFENWLRG